MQEGKKKEYTYQVMYVCMYILCYQPIAKNVAHKILLHINGNHSILGMVEKK